MSIIDYGLGDKYIVHTFADSPTIAPIGYFVMGNSKPAVGVFDAQVNGTWLDVTPALTAAEQAVIDLNSAGVNTNTVEAALYLDHRGNSAPITAIDASIDAVVISSGLTLSTVSNLI